MVEIAAAVSRLARGLSSTDPALSSQARQRLIDLRFHCAAALPIFASFFLQSETAWRTLLYRGRYWSLRLNSMSAGILHIEESMMWGFSPVDCFCHSFF